MHHDVAYTDASGARVALRAMGEELLLFVNDAYVCEIQHIGERDHSLHIRARSGAKHEFQVPVGQELVFKELMDLYRRQPPLSGAVLSPSLLGLPVDKMPETIFEKQMLPRVPKDVPPQFVVDVGANVGHFAMSVAEFGHASISYEPAPSTCEKLKKNIDKVRLSAERLSEMQVVCAAVSDTTGEVAFEIPEGKADESFAMSAKDGKNHGKVRSVKVPVVTLDDTVKLDATQDIMLLKTDTQGFELGVLKGAAKVLRTRRPHFLLVELSRSLLRRAGSSPLELMQLIDGFGFTCVHLAVHEMVTGASPPRGRIVTEWNASSYTSIPFENVEDMLTHGRTGGVWTDLLCW